MNTLHKYAFVKYNYSHNKEFDLGNGITLIRPDGWHTEHNQEKYEGNVNRLETNPQVATVLITSPSLKIAKGEKIFLHYMAKEWAEEMNIEGMDGEMIQGDYIFFKILEDETFDMRDNTYLGERVLEGEQSTASGIIFEIGERPVASTIKITHVPQITTKESEWVQIGDTVITVDDSQYIFEYGGKKYVKLTADEIVGKVKDKELNQLA